jgi:hypothetical protein
VANLLFVNSGDQADMMINSARLDLADEIVAHTAINRNSTMP